MIPYLLAVAGGYLIGSARKEGASIKFDEGGAISQAKEIKEEEYYDMLGAVPPIYFKTINGVSVNGGFAIGEPYSHQQTPDGIKPTYNGYFRTGDLYSNGTYYTVGLVYFVNRNDVKTINAEGGMMAKKINKK